jgi:hypothetical protein
MVPGLPQRRFRRPLAVVLATAAAAIFLAAAPAAAQRSACPQKQW